MLEVGQAMTTLMSVCAFCCMVAFILQAFAGNFWLAVAYFGFCVGYIGLGAINL